MAKISCPKCAYTTNVSEQMEKHFTCHRHARGSVMILSNKEQTLKVLRDGFDMAIRLAKEVQTAVLKDGYVHVGEIIADLALRIERGEQPVREVDISHLASPTTDPYAVAYRVCEKYGYQI